MSQHRDDQQVDSQTHPDELLPWWVNHTLPPEEQRLVGEHLGSCERCTREVQLLQQMREQIQDVPVHSPGQFGLHRLLAEVRRKRDKALPPWEPYPKWRRHGIAVAAALVIMIQTGLLIHAWWFSAPVVPLSGPAGTAGQREMEQSRIIVQVRFAPTATEAQIRETVTTVGGTIVDGPGALGVYRLRLRVPPDDSTSVTRAVQYLRDQKEIVTHVAQE